MLPLIKLINILCRACIIAIRVVFLDRKYSRLIRKKRYDRANDTYNNMMELIYKGLAYCDYAATLMGS